VRLIRACEAFKETNFTYVFLFLINDIYITTVSSLINSSYACVLIFTTFS